MPRIKKLDLIPIFSFFIPYIIYLLTLPSTVWFGDSGDFITSSYVLGIPHPSGYPFYTILGHLFSYILFTYTDHEFMTLWYLKYIEKRREDVLQFNLYDLTTGWVVERILKEHPDIKFTEKLNSHYLFKLYNLVKNNISKFNIFYTFNEDIYNPSYKIVYSESLSNYGILFKVEKEKNPMIYDFSYLIREGNVYKDRFTKGVLKIYAYAYAILGSKYLYSEPKNAKWLFEKAIRFDNENETYKKGLKIAKEKS